MSKFMVALAITVLLLATLSFAQTSKGTISGTVTDQTGAVIKGATVTATDTLGAEVHTATTGDNGQFRIDDIRPSVYSITIAASNYSTFRLERLEVFASVVTPANAELKVGTTNETLTVEASAAAVKTESAELSQNITSREIANLPLATLNPTELVLTLPGVSSINSARDNNTNGFSFSVNGLRPRENNFLIDGFDNNDKGITGQALQPSNQEAIAETVILTNSYAPEFGGAGASVTNTIYKGGTNSWHGSAFERYSQAAWNALEPIQKSSGFTQTPQFVNNIFGFTVGGPVIKNKVFVFGASQWNQFVGAETFAAPLLIPTANGVAALKSITGLAPDQQANLNLLVNSLGGLVAATPSQTPINIGDRPGCGSPCNIEVGNFTRPDKGVSPSQEYSVRVDLLPSQNDSIYARFANTSSHLGPDLFANPGALPTADTIQFGTARNLGAYWTHTFSPKVVNELRFTAQQINFGFDLSSTTLNTPFANLPFVIVSGFIGENLGFGGVTTGFPQFRAHNTYQYQDSVSYVTGNHSFKIGFDIAHLQVSDGIPFNSFGTVNVEADLPGSGNCRSGGASSDCSALANWIDNFSGPTGISAISFGNPLVSYPQTVQAYYFQDAWKIRSNLTFTYGLRYEYQGTPANAAQFPAVPNDPNTAAFTFTNPVTQAFLPNRIPQQPDRNDFGPRVGIAYSPRIAKWLFGENKTAIRIGAGVFYDQFFSNILDNIVGTSPNAAGNTLQAPKDNSRGTPGVLQTIAGFTPVVSTFDQVNTIVSDLKAPRIYQFNLDIQRELPWNTLFDLAYVGTRGRHLFSNEEMNPGFNGVRLNPNAGIVLARGNHDKSNYNGLQLNITHRFSKGLYLQGAYTYSKSLDEGSEIFTTSGGTTRWQVPFNPSSDYGPSAFDRKHRAAITGIWDLPSPHSSFLRTAIGGWQIGGTAQFQSGAPETIYLNGIDINGDLNFGNDRPSVGNPAVPINFATCGGVGGDPSSTCNSGVGFSLDGVHFVDFFTSFGCGNPSCSTFSATAQDFHYYFVNGQPGTLRRNSFYNPGRQDYTAQISKSFQMPYNEGHHLLLRLEMFNPFNHHNLGGGAEVPGVSGNLLNPNFGNVAITEESERNIRVFLRYSF